MTKTLSMVSHKNYNLGDNEGFVIFLISKLITCFIDGFTSKMKPQSIAYLLNGNKHIYWILDLDDELHSIWVIWTNNLRECKGNFIFQSRAEQAINFGWDFIFFVESSHKSVMTGPNPYAPCPKSS